MHVTDRIDAVTKVTQDFATPTPPAPKSVKMSITERCNHACGYCALRLRKKRPGELSQANYARIVKEAAEFGVQEVGVFFMGEPTMVEWIGEAVEIAKKSVPYVFCTTNGTYFRALSRYTDMMRAGLDSLKFSLNYSDAKQYAEITGCIPEGFDKLVSNIKSTRQVRDLIQAPTKLWASAIQYDGEQGARMAKVVKEVEPYLDGPVYHLPLYSMGAFATKREEELGFRPTAGNQGRIGALREPIPCWTAFTAAHVGVTEEGRPYLSACCFDASGKWNMGFLDEGKTFAEVWHSQAFRNLRTAHLRKDISGTICEKCLAYE